MRDLQEAYLGACGLEAAPATALTCRLMVNSLRWAAGLAADGSNGTTFRLAMTSGVVSTTALNAIKTAAVRDNGDGGFQSAATAAAVTPEAQHAPTTSA